jgi:hypothetical protein
MINEFKTLLYKLEHTDVQLKKKHNTDNILLITSAEIFAKIIHDCKSKELDVYAKMLWDLGAFSTAEVLEVFSWRIKQGNVNTSVFYELTRLKFDERITKYLPN